MALTGPRHYPLNVQLHLRRSLLLAFQLMQTVHTLKGNKNGTDNRFPATSASPGQLFECQSSIADNKTLFVNSKNALGSEGPFFSPK